MHESSESFMLMPALSLHSRGAVRNWSITLSPLLYLWRRSLILNKLSLSCNRKGGGPHYLDRPLNFGDRLRNRNCWEVQGPLFFFMFFFRDYFLTSKKFNWTPTGHIDILSQARLKGVFQRLCLTRALVTTCSITYPVM